MYKKFCELRHNTPCHWMHRLYFFGSRSQLKPKALEEWPKYYSVSSNFRTVKIILIYEFLINLKFWKGRIKSGPQPAHTVFSVGGKCCNLLLLYLTTEYVLENFVGGGNRPVAPCVNSSDFRQPLKTRDLLWFLNTFHCVEKDMLKQLTWCS